MPNCRGSKHTQPGDITDAAVQGLSEPPGRRMRQLAQQARFSQLHQSTQWPELLGIGCSHLEERGGKRAQGFPQGLGLIGLQEELIDGDRARNDPAQNGIVELV
jgi:hypothetical protein